MTPLDVRPNLETAPWTTPVAQIGRLTSVGLLPAGTASGRASVALRATLEDGTEVIIETTWRLFEAAARALSASPVAQAEPPAL